MKFEFSVLVFEKFSNIKFHENPSGGSRVVQCGRTDEQTWNCQSRFSQFRETRL